jgi:DNA topoisomerase-6 subunit A
MGAEREHALKLIERLAAEVDTAIARGRLPALRFPLRTLGNVVYEPDRGSFSLGPALKARTLSANGARSFAQVLRMMAFARQVLRDDDFASKREAYYVSKNWGECRFHSQPESDEASRPASVALSRASLASVVARSARILASARSCSSSQTRSTSRCRCAGSMARSPNVR